MVGIDTMVEIMVTMVEEMDTMIVIVMMKDIIIEDEETEEEDREKRTFFRFETRMSLVY